MSDYALRPMRPEERGFVARSWVESRMPNQRRPAGYFRLWNWLVNELLDRCHVRVAENDAGLVAGFLVWEMRGGLVVHYVYTRLSERRRGVAKRLLAELPVAPTTYTHRGPEWLRIPSNWTYSERPIFARRRAA